MAPIQIINFNCNGFQSAFNDVIDLFNNDDDTIVFLSEHWLQPHELNSTKALLAGEGLWTSLKSSVNPEEELHGRPYGGVGFVCKNTTNDFSIRPVNIDNDRLSAIQLVKDGQTELTVIGVYLPYFNSRPDQLALYAETLDILQSTIDSCSGSPFVILGDMNAPLPQARTLSRHWYKSKPFNMNSMLLYDFMTANDLCVANFVFTQSVNYTYKKGTHRSYIDHVLVPVHLIERLSDCKIICHDDIIASDHFPLKTSYNMPVAPQPMNNKHESDLIQNFPKMNWENESVRNTYQQKLSQALSQRQLRCNGVVNRTDAQYSVNKNCKELISLIHNVCAQISTANRQRKKGRRLPWWSNSCSIARDRMRFWRGLWTQSGKDRNSSSFKCYKLAKKQYRDARRASITKFNSENNKLLKNLFRHGNSKKFWNKVRQLKRNDNSNCNDIDIQTLKDFFQDRFCENRGFDETPLRLAKTETDNKYNVNFGETKTVSVTEEQVVKSIKRLKLGRSHGHDGVQSEHLRYALGTGVEKILSEILTICGIYSVLPESFVIGLLVPILKKPTLDPSVPKSYRPIIVSSVFSKILEYVILDSVQNYKPHDLQFGFVEQRNTNMAICISRDVIEHFNRRGSAVYTCTLDAEMAFDGIPHCVLLQRAIGIIPDPWWHVMFVWYHNLVVKVKWNGSLSNTFKIEKGTRQGGLTSPLLFNLFYYDLVESLSNCHGGIKVKGHSYNVFAYADDILLTSSTCTGLQKLIDVANDYLSDHGLNFNAGKSKCKIFGKCFLEPHPSWNLGGNILECTESFEYLGAVMSNKSSHHTAKRLKACRQGFYSLQSAGMHSRGCNPRIVSYLWKAALQPTLTYANECFSMRNYDMYEMEKMQARLLKCSLGLSKYSYTSPLLDSLSVKRILNVTDSNSLKLFKKIVTGTSKGKDFYLSKMHFATDCDLYSRCKKICEKKQLSLVRFLFNENVLRNDFKQSDGLVDSLKMCFDDYDNKKELAKLLLSPFNLL